MSRVKKILGTLGIINIISDLIQFRIVFLEKKFRIFFVDYGSSSWEGGGGGGGGGVFCGCGGGGGERLYADRFDISGEILQKISKGLYFKYNIEKKLIERRFH